MNLLKLSFLLVLLVAFSACGDDEETNVCAQADWVGSYTGSQVCDGADAEDATVTITASGTDAIVIITNVPGLESEYDPLTPDNCDLNVSQTDSGITLSVDATIDGDNLSFTEVLSAGGNTSTCTITATRD